MNDLSRFTQAQEGVFDEFFDGEPDQATLTHLGTDGNS